MKTVYSPLLLIAGAAAFLLPEALWAAGGSAEMLVVVADSRQVSSGVNRYLLDMYNTNPMGFGILCVITTAILGCGLGLITDFFMKMTGIDLKSRKIVEH